MTQPRRPGIYESWEQWLYAAAVVGVVYFLFWVGLQLIDWAIRKGVL